MENKPCLRIFMPFGFLIRVNIKDMMDIEKIYLIGIASIIWILKT